MRQRFKRGFWQLSNKPKAVGNGHFSHLWSSTCQSIIFPGSGTSIKINGRTYKKYLIHTYTFFFWQYQTLHFSANLDSFSFTKTKDKTFLHLHLQRIKQNPKSQYRESNQNQSVKQFVSIRRHMPTMKTSGKSKSLKHLDFIYCSNCS